MKLCKACGCEKPETEFHKDRSKADGLNAYCKPCHIARQREYVMRPPRHKAPEGMKRCSRCKETKPLSEFHAAITFDGKERMCKACRYKEHDSWRCKNLDKAAAHGRKWRKENPERYRDHMLKANYGIPLGTYDEMLAKQDGKCAICGSEKTNGKGDRFHVDHCHDSKQIRGLLCHNCNVGIGHLQHDPNILRSALRYVELFIQTLQKTR